MINPFPPAFIFIIGALAIPFLKGRIKQAYLLFLPVLGFIDIISLQPGTSWVYPFLSYQLVLCQVDQLSMVIGYIFLIIGFLALLYSIHVKEDGQHIAALMYLGSSLGVVFAGDFFSLFVYWEIMAATSVFLIWFRREKESLDAGFRYILMHLIGGGILLTGIILHIESQNSITIGVLSPGWAYAFILVGFGLNTAFIPLHTWLPDSYPRGTITGSVFLSVYTTKTGVYVLARCFPASDLIAYMGGVMAIYGVVFALLQNETRKLLSYHIVSQVGYMVAGVGIGTQLGVNGGIAHVFNHILYKALLFMCMGSVIFMTGKRKLTELGGIAKYMPVTCLACIIASLSISGAPGFNGFVSKGMVISSAAEAHKSALVLLLTLASIGTFLSFIKLCYFCFFAKNEHITAEDPPLNMQLAMGITAFLCVFIGLYPQSLFHILPHPAHYHTFTLHHIAGTLQLIFLSGFAFLIARKVFAPHEGLILDFDYFYRKGARGIAWFSRHPLNDFRLGVQKSLSGLVEAFAVLGNNPHAAPWIIIGKTELALATVLNRTLGTPGRDLLGTLQRNLQTLQSGPGRARASHFPIGIWVAASLAFLLILATLGS